VIATYDGLDPTALSRRWLLPRVVVLEKTTSTMDEAHSLAARGALGGTLVLAHSQTAGRGRSGGTWIAVEGASILCTMVERPARPGVLDVLSLRIGLGVASALDSYAEAPVGVKWPNDLIIDGGKVAGILVEARWRDTRLEWVAVAIGINVGAPPSDVSFARGLRAGTSRLEVLDVVIPALRGAAIREGPLSATELAAWAARDRLFGKRIVAPIAGKIRGLLPTGELLVDGQTGEVAIRSGSVTLEPGTTL
jgi:BirA family biotin operon repressor/biotin-[acetyl-CoA-carboxylase] ligase